MIRVSVIGKVRVRVMGKMGKVRGSVQLEVPFKIGGNRRVVRRFCICFSFAFNGGVRTGSLAF